MTESSIATLHIKVDPVHPERKAIEEAALILRRGGLVAFPTETVYGLGANALDGRAVARIFEAKGRPSDNPIIVHVAVREQVSELTGSFPAAAKLLMDAFWPGPLTLVLPVAKKVPGEVTAGLSTVAVRMPDHPVALALIRTAGVPVAAPSANISGRPSPTSAEHVMHDLNGRIEAVLDGGPAGVGVESTVLDLTAQAPVVLRPGGITPEDLREVLGKVDVDPAAAAGFNKDDKPLSPGMKYIHYAPLAPLRLVLGKPEAVASKIKELACQEKARGRKVGILTFSDSDDFARCGEVVVAGCREKPETVAAVLYSALRRFNDLGVDIIFAEGLAEHGVGLAVMNRLKKAAGGHIINV
ncbi:L-threonylcarbamoyladenylate synthase [Pelotomaculum propionicicum]|uniref:Threonylcarbamoyl-AMP synthase n=1 Tax=Pelotomaculum propionicicum TaxID=258475 RepID=A0A4Y7RYC3_9FIRM|nr:L-threonylcarbamoyladenylate synthase [Pelotomaculum propionicicum]NLI14000.1 threonylcarbamoyl-AMP synthase [Peptococcaceae bacterium]TEB13642.1 Threonylcarbamoyl-AMP synthase [Pelotomaculum propionicicum]